MIRPLALAAMLCAQPAAAQVVFQDTTAIDIAVAAFTGHAVGTEGGARTAVDKRLKLAQCPLPQLDWRGTWQDAVVVSCDAPRWRIHVPVKMAPKAIAAVSAPVAPAPRAEPVIRRGDPVTVEAGNAGFSITRDGVAMGDAVAGARLMVRVDPAKPPIQGVAIANGRVGLPGWDR